MKEKKNLCFPHCLAKSVCLKFTKTRRDWSLMLNPRQPLIQTCLKFLVLVLFVWLRSLLLQLFYWSSPLGCSIVGRSGKGDKTVHHATHRKHEHHMFFCFKIHILLYYSSITHNFELNYLTFFSPQMPERLLCISWI